MKKLLLLGALGAFALGANADDFSQYFKVMYNGQEVPNDGEIVISDYTYDEEWEEWEMSVLHVQVLNQEDEPRAIGCRMTYLNPMQDEFQAQGLGGVSLCFANAYDQTDACIPSFEKNVVSQVNNNVSPSSSSKILEYQIHRTGEGLASVEVETQFRLYLQALDGDAKGDTEPIEDADFQCFIKYGSKLGAVKNLNYAPQADTEYFTLDGQRLQAPVKGIYLEKKGSKVTKRLGI